MLVYDLPLNELYSYKPIREEPSDFEEFWKSTINEQSKYDLEYSEVPYVTEINTVNVYDVTFSGWKGQPIKGWLIRPKSLSSPAPCIIEFPSYGGGRGLPWDWLHFPSAGFVYFVMDNRGQGSGWRQGDTADYSELGYLPHSPGVMSLGVLDKENYFYRRLFMDAYMAVKHLMRHPFVQKERVGVTGISQGGGVSVVMSALIPEVSLVLSDVTFLSHYRRALEITTSHPYAELINYCQVHPYSVEKVFNTLSYFDVVNFAPRAKAPAQFSVGLRDDVAPPSTVFAVYNWYQGQKKINVWPYNGHESGGTLQVIEKVKFARKALMQ